MYTAAIYNYLFIYGARGGDIYSIYNFLYIEFHSKMHEYYMVRDVSVNVTVYILLRRFT